MSESSIDGKNYRSAKEAMCASKKRLAQLEENEISYERFVIETAREVVRTLAPNHQLKCEDAAYGAALKVLEKYLSEPEKPK